MTVLASRLDPAADAYRANRATNLDLLAELERLLERTRAGRGSWPDGCETGGPQTGAGSRPRRRRRGRCPQMSWDR
jgi:hypothetical protein